PARPEGGAAPGAVGAGEAVVHLNLGPADLLGGRGGRGPREVNGDEPGRVEAVAPRLLGPDRAPGFAVHPAQESRHRLEDTAHHGTPGRELSACARGYCCMAT